AGYQLALGHGSHCRDAIYASYRNMFTRWIDCRKRYKLGIEAPDLIRVFGFADGVDFYQTNFGSGVDHSGIDLKSFRLNDLSVFGRRKFPAYADNPAIANEYGAVFNIVPRHGVDGGAVDQISFISGGSAEQYRGGE